MSEETKMPLLIGIGCKNKKVTIFRFHHKIWSNWLYYLQQNVFTYRVLLVLKAEYNSLINDVTFGDFAAERQVEVSGPDAYDFIRLITPRNLSKCEIGDCKYIILTDQDGGIVK